MGGRGSEWAPPPPSRPLPVSATTAANHVSASDQCCDYKFNTAANTRHLRSASDQLFGSYRLIFSGKELDFSSWPFIIPLQSNTARKWKANNQPKYFQSAAQICYLMLLLEWCFAHTHICPLSADMALPSPSLNATKYYFSSILIFAESRMMESLVVPLIMAFLIASGASHTDLSSGISKILFRHASVSSTYPCQYVGP